MRLTPTQTCRRRWASREAEEASKRYAGFEHHAYPTCFTCGPERDDGLGIFAGPVAGREGVVAAPWTPKPDVRAEIVWAALDCPSGWAVDDFQREGVLLGRMAASIHARPEPGEAHAVIGWRIGEEGRKRFAGSALYTADRRPRRPLALDLDRVRYGKRSRSGGMTSSLAEPSPGGTA